MPGNGAAVLAYGVGLCPLSRSASTTAGQHRRSIHIRGAITMFPVSSIFGDDS